MSRFGGFGGLAGAGGGGLGGLFGGAAGAEQAHNIPKVAASRFGDTAGMLGGEGGGLEGTLLASMILGSMGDMFGSSPGRRSGGAMNNLLPMMLLAKQFGLFKTNAPKTRVVGQETPTEGTRTETTPQAGTVAPIGSSGPELGDAFGMGKIFGLGNPLSGAPSNPGGILGVGGNNPLFSLR